MNNSSEWLPKLPNLEREEKARIFAQANLLSFAISVDGAYQTAPHLRTVARNLEELEQRKITKAMLLLPPRHGKSRLSSEIFPSWYLGRHPSEYVIMASYSQELATDFGRKVRNLMKEDNYKGIFPGISLSDDSTAASRFHTNKGGACYSVGVGSGLTGFGGNLLIIDDPHKDREEANSITVRNRVWDWYSSTLSTRQMPNAVFLLIMTRWHPDDLAGRILSSEDGPNWKVISMPAIDANDKALWPERYSKESLMAIKKSMILADWQSLYMQHPTIEEGAIIKRHWWQYYSTLPKRFDKVIQAWDFAVKDKRTSDYTVGMVVGKLGANRYILDVVRERLSFPDACNAVVTLSNKWPSATKKVVESKANGPAVVQTLKNKLTGLVEFEPEGDKVQRVSSISPEIESGNWYLPDPSTAHWTNTFLQEVSDFPNSINDDMVDCLSMAGMELRGSSNIGKVQILNRSF